MRKTSYIGLFLILFLLSGLETVYGQSRSKQEMKQRKKLNKLADDYFEYGDYLNALKIYDSLYVTDSLSPILNFNLGACVMVLRGYCAESAEYFIKASEGGYTEAYYFTANWFHLQNDFDKAVEFYNKYKTSTDLKAIEDEVIDNHIDICDRARTMMRNAVDVRIENMGPVINSEYDEYVPIVAADESILIFTSRRKGGTGGKLDPYGQYFEDIYVSYKENEEWTLPQKLDTTINTSGHDACVSLSHDGYTLITYKSDSSHTTGNLYWSILEDEKWNRPVKYGPYINTIYIEPSATISVDDNTIYFSSDRPGGYGGKDLYRVVRLPNGEWSLPYNLGPTINTELDEDAPFIHPDNITLYFSSEGHSTMGNYDIFKSELYDNGTWQKPKNLGYPINTTDDDIYFMLSADGRRGYYASGVSGGYGEQDLYVIHMPYEFRQYTIVRGIVTSNDSLETPLSARITLVEYDVEETRAVYNTSSRTGKYLLIIPPGKKFRMSVEAEGYRTLNKVIQYEAGNFSQLYEPIKLKHQQE